MRLFLDAEFVAPNFHLLSVVGLKAMRGAKLLSLAFVGEADEELYVEVTDAAARKSASDFVSSIVLPQLGLEPTRVEVRTLADAGRVLADFLERQEGLLEVTADFGGDVMLLVEALKAAGRFEALEPRLRLDMASWTSRPGNEEAWQAAFDRRERESAGLLRHHALLDARVLKDVFTLLYDDSQAKA